MMHVFSAMPASAKEQPQASRNNGTWQLIRGLLANAVLTSAFVVVKATGATFTDGNWTPVGSGLNNTVYALAVSGTNLYAGGKFTVAGGVPANGVAKWDGSTWSALGSGTDG